MAAGIETVIRNQKVVKMLEIVCVVLAVLLGFSLFLNFKALNAGAQLRKYDSFFTSTILEIEEELVFFQDLLKKNIVLAHDDEIKKAHICMRKFYNIMVGFYETGKTTLGTKGSK